MAGYFAKPPTARFLNWAHPLAKPAGLVSGWFFNGQGALPTAGQTLRDVTRQNSGTITYNASSSWTTCTYGSAFGFNGGSAVTVADSPSLSVGSDSFWFAGVYTLSTTSGVQTFVDKRVNTTNFPGYTLFTNGGTFSCQLNSSGGSSSFGLTGTVTANLCQPFVWIVNRQTSLTYLVLGGKVFSASFAAVNFSLTTANSLLIGVNTVSSSRFTGNMSLLLHGRGAIVPGSATQRFITDPFEMFRPPRLPVPVKPLPVITASLSLTQAGNTLSAAGSAAVAAAVSRTQAGNTLAATGAAAVGASLSATQAGNTQAAAGSAVVSAAAAVTQADDAVSATGRVSVPNVYVMPPGIWGHKVQTPGVWSEV